MKSTCLSNNSLNDCLFNSYKFNYQSLLFCFIAYSTTFSSFFLALEVVLLNDVVVHDLSLLESICVLVLAHILVDDGFGHVAQQCMSSEVNGLHHNDDPQDVFDLKEAEGLLEDASSVHAEQRIGHVEPTQVEHAILSI